MATYTTNYNLPKYEADDLPNLLDEYNSAMDKIDAQMKTTDNAATQAGTAAGNANTTAQQALSLAQTNESDIAGIETDVTNINSQLSTQMQLINSHATELQDHESRITTLQNNETELGDQVTENTAAISTKAPINHASTSGTYGLGNATNFGHVKLSDEAGTDGASQGVAASPLAVSNIISQYLTSSVTHSETIEFSGEVNAKYIFNIVTYGKIVAISMSNDPAEGGTQITSTGAASSGWQSLTYTLPANLRPSRTIFLNPYTYIYKSGVTINMLIRVQATGAIDVDITTTSGIGSPLTIGGNVMFIGAGTGTL